MARARAERDGEIEGRRDGWKEGGRAQLCVLRDVGCPPDPAVPPRRPPPPLTRAAPPRRSLRISHARAHGGFADSCFLVDYDIMFYLTMMLALTQVMPVAAWLSPTASPSVTLTSLL